jgi:hypothetical protein
VALLGTQEPVQVVHRVQRVIEPVPRARGTRRVYVVFDTGDVAVLVIGDRDVVEVDIR